MFDIKEELKKLPGNPGVYIMHSADDTVIYVGKAKVLKNRVRQYFQNSANHTPKVKAMVANIAYFEYIITDSEIEALVLECNLIKKYQPRYNILLKDDKQYPYIKVTINEEYPRVMMTRTLKNDGAKYFGPYTGSNTIRNTLEIVQKIFKPPTCHRRFPDDIGKGRPCLNYHINNCFAPCIGNVTKDEYRAVFFDICSFLDGNHTKLLAQMNKEMQEASDQMEFERAANLRDKIRSIEAIGQKQKIIDSDKQIDKDIIAFELLADKAFVEVFFVRSGKVVGRENYRIDHAAQQTEGEVMTDFVKQFYAAAIYIPGEILTEYGIEDEDVVREWLSGRRGKKVNLQTPKRGEKRRLVELVKKNAQIAAENYKIAQKKEEEKKNILKELAACMGLEKEPVRIESYDISNISGAENVASMIVFENGKPARSKYRKFKIKSFEGADDYAAMREVIYRRFRRALDEEQAIEAGTLNRQDAKFLPRPDVILLDGGKGHLHAVQELLEEIDTDVPIFGMVKDDKHRTRALVSDEGEIGISMISSVFHFITRVQDEVHRTAISYHRKLRQKQMVKSELDDIPGIGKKRRAALLGAFGSVSNMKKASVDELCAVSGMDRKSAKSVYRYFHNG